MKRSYHLLKFNLLVLAAVLIISMVTSIEDSRENNQVEIVTNSYAETSDHMTEVGKDVKPLVEEVTPYISMTDEDIYILATLVYLECGAESFDCQCAVASVVVNRMTTRNMSLYDIIYEPYQFSPAELITQYEPSDSSLAAAKKVVQDGPTIPEYVTFFRADYYFDWGDRYVDYMNIDKTYFSYDKYLKEEVESGK